MLAGTRQLRLEGPVYVRVHRTERVNGSEGRKGVNRGGNGDGIGVGGRNGVVNDDRDGDGARTRTGVGAN